MIYHDESGNVITNPDMTKGKIVSESQVVIAHHDAVEEVSHMEVMPGTESMNQGKGLQHKVIDTPASDAWDEYDTLAIYHAYTTDEQAAYDAGLEAGKNIVTLNKQITDTQLALCDVYEQILK